MLGGATYVWSMKTASILAATLLAGSAALAKSSQELQVRSPQSTFSAQVTQESIRGPGLQLDMTPESMRGQAFGRPVALTLEHGRIQGTVGEGPVDLQLQERTETVLLRGTFAGQPARFRLSHEELTGNVGACVFELIIDRNRRQYDGKRTCGSGPQTPVTVVIPSELKKDTDEQRMAALAIVLSQPR